MTASAGPLAVSNTQPSLSTSSPTTLATAIATETGITSPTPTSTSIKERDLESLWETTKDDIEDWFDHPDDN